MPKGAVSHISRDAVEAVWATSTDPSWSELARSLKDGDRTPPGISPDLAAFLAELIEHLAESGEPFPASARELRELLNRRAALLAG